MFKNIFFSILIWVLESLLVASLITVNWSHRVGELEDQWMLEYLGEKEAQYIKKNAIQTYHSVFVDSGFRDSTYEFFIPSESQRRRSVGMQNFGRKDIFPIIKERLDVIWSSIFQVCQRIYMMGIWMPYALILFVPFVTDGLVNRKIKQYGFDYSSPLLHRFGIFGFGLTFYVCLIAMFAPIPIPIVAMPFVCMALAIFLGTFVANIQKRI